jgi:hypothetical protein
MAVPSQTIVFTSVGFSSENFNPGVSFVTVLSAALGAGDER